MTAARKIKEYRGRCKMKGTDLVIRGKRYSWNNLHDLPQNISTHTVSSQQDSQHYGFFGELNPLSTFTLHHLNMKELLIHAVSNSFKLAKPHLAVT